MAQAHRGAALDRREFPAADGWVARESRRWGRRPRPAAFALGTHGAGRRRSAVPPHLPPGGPAVTHPGDRACPSGRAVLPAPGDPVAAKAHCQDIPSAPESSQRSARLLASVCRCSPGARQPCGRPAVGLDPGCAWHGGQLRAAGRGNERDQGQAAVGWGVPERWPQAACSS